MTITITLKHVSSVQAANMLALAEVIKENIDAAKAEAEAEANENPEVEEGPTEDPVPETPAESPKADETNETNETDPETDPETNETVPTADDLYRLAVAFSHDHKDGKETLSKLLSQYGVKKVSRLPAEHVPAMYQELKSRMKETA